MNYKTHSIVALTTVGSIAITAGSMHTQIFGISVYPILMLATAHTGGIKPDIDMESTKAGRAWAAKLFTHRGFTHTPVATSFAFLIASLIASSGQGLLIDVVNSLLMGFFIGYATHVLIDTFNYNGCPIFWPLYQKNLYIFRVSTKNSFAKTMKDKRNNWQEPAFLGIWIVGIVIHTLLILGGFTL